MTTIIYHLTADDGYSLRVRCPAGEEEETLDRAARHEERRSGRVGPWTIERRCGRHVQTVGELLVGEKATLGVWTV